MKTDLFITGTDTDVGKTYVMARMLRLSNELGVCASAFKPLAAGAHWQRGRLLNEDNQALMSVVGEPRFRNSYVFEPFVSPHIAANREQCEVREVMLDRDLDELRSIGAPVLIEGAGGWHVPVSNTLLYSDWVARHKFDVVMVVSIKLGCINHSMLTANAIAEAGLTFRGWYANFVDNSPYCAEQIESLSSLLNCQPLAALPNRSDVGLSATDAEVALLKSL